MTIMNKIEPNGNEFINNCIIEAGMTYGKYNIFYSFIFNQL